MPRHFASKVRIVGGGLTSILAAFEAHRLGVRASGLLAFACLAVATALITFGPGLPVRPLLVVGLIIGLAAVVAGVVLLLRRSPTRLLMQLIMTCAIVDVVMLALAGQSIAV